MMSGQQRGAGPRTPPRLARRRSVAAPDGRLGATTVAGGGRQGDGRMRAGVRRPVHRAEALAGRGAVEAGTRFDAGFRCGLRTFGVLTGTPGAGPGLPDAGRAWRITPGNAPLDFSFGIEATFVRPAAGTGAPSGHG